MNSLQNSERILVDLLFRRHDEERLFFKDIIEGPFKDFRGVLKERCLKTYLTKALEAKFGQEVGGTDRTRKVFFRVALKFHVSEGSYIEPVDYQEFEFYLVAIEFPNCVNQNLKVTIV